MVFASVSEREREMGRWAGTGASDLCVRRKMCILKIKIPTLEEMWSYWDLWIAAFFFPQPIFS